jgi:hypothetical protein
MIAAGREGGPQGGEGEGIDKIPPAASDVSQNVQRVSFFMQKIEPS